MGEAVARRARAVVERKAVVEDRITEEGVAVVVMAVQKLMEEEEGEVARMEVEEAPWVVEVVGEARPRAAAAEGARS